jgi:class 3 adenylate cyclase/tetratricopeptide (TPR) repeat protein
MLCPSCQNDAPGGSKFCNGCGARLDAACPQCGHGNPPGSRFCTECGHGLTAPSPSAPVAQSPSPQTYTPKHLAERILTTRAALEGERKQVTVLFADLKGSMELLADRDPEEARRILDPVLERMMEAVHRYEGTVNQVMGDGIMALFGAPLAHEDHAVRACYAALRMQASIKQYAQELQRTEGAFIQIRVGLNSGEVVVRSIGSDLHMDYTAVGQTTHLAARMEQLAAPGSILLAPDTLRLVEGYVQVRALGPMQVKGVEAPVEAYEFLGAGAARSRLQAAAGRGFTKFVGRDTELETLRQTLDRAGSGHGQVVALVGEPGVGKSRLTWEFTHSHRAQDWLVLESGSVSYGKATPYFPVIDLLKAYCGIESRDDPRRIREKLTGKLLTLDPALQPTLPAFLALLDLPVEDAQWDALDPAQRRSRTLDACKRLLLRESQVQPLLLVFEDLHWIDAETQALLDSLIDSLPAARLLLLVNYRPEYEHTWHGKTYYRELRLDPLPPEGAAVLLRALVGDDPALQPLKTLLVARTEGNPFFLEESVRTLVESGALVGDGGAYRLAQAVETTRVPATVQAVLAARIDRLAPEDKRLLQAAAVIGKDVPAALLLAIAELPEEALRVGLGRLQAAEFLYEASLFPDLEYTFKHALTHEVAYGSLLHERRRDLHARIVEAIETLYPDRVAEHAERLAHHAYHGELWDQAVVYLRQAGAKAMAQSAHREAIAYFEQALAALTHLPESRDARSQAVDLRIDLWAVFSRGLNRRSPDYLQEAERLAEGLEDPRRLGQVAADQASYYWAIGEHDRALEYGQRALACATASGELSLQVRAKYPIGQAYAYRGEYRQAIDTFAGITAALEGDLRFYRYGTRGFPFVLAYHWLALCLTELGEFAQAIPRGQEAIRLAEMVDDPWSIASAHWGLGYVYLRQGNLPRAIAVVERGWQICEAWELPAQSPLVAGILGHAYIAAGRIAEGLPLLEDAVERSASVPRLVYLAEAYLRAGRMEEASHTAVRARERAGYHKERGHEAYALCISGEIAACADPPDAEQAESHYRQALALAEELGMRPLAAHCHLGLGTLYQRVGRDNEAHGELATTAEMYRAMETPFWLVKAEAVLAKTGG